MRSQREPGAGKPHARFDERRLETERWRGLRHRHRESRRQTATLHSLPPPRQSSTLPVTLRLATDDDAVDEVDATLTLTLGESNTYALGDPATAAVTVRDDDLPVVTVAADETAVTEGEEAVFTLTRDGLVSGPLKVSYAFRIAEGGAQDGASGRSRDGGGFGTAGDEQSADTVTFEAGKSTVQVRPRAPDDDIDSAARTFVLWLVSGAGDRLGDPSRAMMTVLDNDDVDGPDKRVTVSATARNPQGITAPDAVTLTIMDDDTEQGLSIGDANVREGDAGSTALVFTVTLTPAATAPVTVDWATADGTAQAGTDYVAGNGSLTFDTGEDRKTVSVPVAGDDVDEPDETFTVTLSNESGAPLGRAAMSRR